MKTRLDERIENSIALLDRHEKDWLDYIMISRLDMQDPRKDILGQIYKEYFSALEKLDITYAQSCYTYAFNDLKGRYKELTQAWKEKLRELRREKEKC